MWEQKTGRPVKQYHAKGTFAAEPYQNVKCTGLGVWWLQTHYTKLALQQTGVAIAHARIIQIHENKKTPMTLKIHDPLPWL